VNASPTGGFRFPCVAHAPMSFLTSVRIDVEQLLKERDERRAHSNDGVSSHSGAKPRTSSKRKAEKSHPPKAKKVKVKSEPSSSSATTSGSANGKLTVTLKLGPRPTDSEPFPCCLCVSMQQDTLLRVHDPPITRGGEPLHKLWMAHEHCASVVPETWVDEIEVGEEGQRRMEKVVFGVDGIVKDRWNLVSSVLM
jgi:hypothetical protein